VPLRGAAAPALVPLPACLNAACQLLLLPHFLARLPSPLDRPPAHLPAELAFLPSPADASCLPACLPAAGGRNLKPGQALESDEAAAARQARVNAALKEYRKTLGLDVDPAVEQQAQVGGAHAAYAACSMLRVL